MYIKVVVLIVNHHGLPLSLISSRQTEENAVDSFQDEECTLSDSFCTIAHSCGYNSLSLGSTQSTPG